MGVFKGRKSGRLSDEAIKRLNDSILQQRDPDAEHLRGREEGAKDAYCYTFRSCAAAAATVLARDYAFTEDQLISFLGEMDLAEGQMHDSKKLADALGRMGIKVAPEDEIGERIRQKNRRNVLCEKCLMGDRIGGGVWDCDMIDGITSGKTECKHYREDPDQ